MNVVNEKNNICIVKIKTAAPFDGVAGGDTFLHSVCAQAPRENLARIKQES